NAPAGLLPFTAAAATDRMNLAALVAETTNVTEGAGFLRNGTNILATHGLNDSATNGAFFILPELAGGAVLSFSNRFLAPATPGTLNGRGVGGFVEDTQFSARRGFFTAPFSMEITTPTDGARIYFTTNGSLPSPTNPAAILYTGSITI